MTYVLIVDDDDAIRTSVRWGLEEDGYEVYEVDNGKVALEILRASADPLVVVLDRMMRDSDDMAFLRMVRDDPHLTCRHCYLVLTAMVLSRLNLSDNIKCLLAAPIMSKPFEWDTSLAVVAQAAARLSERTSRATRTLEGPSRVGSVKSRHHLCNPSLLAMLLRFSHRARRRLIRSVATLCNMQPNRD